MKASIFQNPKISFLILLIMVFEIFGEILNVHPLRMLKPIPIIMLIINLHFKNGVQDPSLLTVMKYGLILSLVGDIALMYREDYMFMIGTGFFLISHIVYCVGENIGEKKRKITKNKKIVSYVVCFMLFALFLSNVYSLWDVFPNRFLFPFYGFILCLMNMFSILRYEKTNAPSYQQMMVGALLFGISDNILALLKFNNISSHLGKGIVMIFYYGSQFFIMHGTISHSTLRNELSECFRGSSEKI